MYRVQQKGFTIIELMISVAASIFAITILFMMIQYLLMQKLAYAERDVLDQGWLTATRYMKMNYASIVTGHAAGFSNPLKPTLDELYRSGFISSKFKNTTPLRGSLTFTIRVGLSNDLTAIVCDSNPVTYKGLTNEILARRMASLSGSNGTFTTTSQPGILNGSNFQNLSSPIAVDPAICIVSYLPSQQ